MSATARRRSGGAMEHVLLADPAFQRVIDATGPMALRPALETPFHALLRAIVYQQLAGAAAAAIHGRVVALFDSQGGLAPETLLGVAPGALRGAGLSGSKQAAVTDLAARVLDGTVPVHDLDDLSDDEIVARLTMVRGIGRWTAEMFLIFQLRRPDVWPVDDLGVRNGWARIHGLDAPPKAKELDALGDAFRPHRSAAAWYCWRAMETITPG